MNIPEEAKRRYPALQSDNPRAASREFGRDGFIAGAEWARKEALNEAAAFVKSEIERLELVKGTYAKAQRHSLGLVWGHIRSDVLTAEGVSDGQQ